VFTSGGTITALLHLITHHASQAFTLNWQIINTSLSQLKFRGRDVALASFNSQAHVQLLRAPGSSPTDEARPVVSLRTEITL
jgi:broad specificity phosphatase PhoE